MYEEPTKPETPDYYFDLGVTQDATKAEIKRAFCNLALLHHPDKKAPGESIDAVEFRQAREAYEVLNDTDEKATYDAEYVWLQLEWTRYRCKLKDWEKYLEDERLRKEAEELARRRAAEEEERRKANVEAERHRKEEAKKKRQAFEDSETRRGNFANWAYREAARLKEEAREKEEEERWQQELEDMARRREAAEEQEKQAEELRRKVRDWAKQKGIVPEEERRRQQQEEEMRRKRRAERDQRRQARGYPPREHGPLCPCLECMYEYDANWWANQPSQMFKTEQEFQQREEEAVRATEEAAQRAREENERKAKERLEKQLAAEKKKQDREQLARDRTKAAKARAADKTTRAAAQKQREEQEKKARVRMANEHIVKQQQAYLSDLAERGQEVGVGDVVIDIGWVKKKGVAECLFCGEGIKYYSFCCPEGGAVACNPCKGRLSQFTPPSMEETVDEDGVTEGLSRIELEDDAGGE